MGLKIKKRLNLHLTPACFYVESTDDRSSGDEKKTTPIILIGCDGWMRVYQRPVLVSELMSEHPHHLVCRSDDCFIGRKVPPLEAGEKLVPGHSYFLLPDHLFHSVLSFVALAAAAKASYRLPFGVHRTAAGTLQIRVSDEFVVQKAREEEEKREEWLRRSGSRVVTSEGLEKEYRTLVKSRRWRPKLEAIGESVEKKSRSTRELCKQFSSFKMH